MLRIAEIKERIADGFEDLSAYSDRVYLLSKLEAAESKLTDIQTVLDGIEEVCPSNYDHDQVCKMNAGVCELFSFFEWPIKGDK